MNETDQLIKKLQSRSIKALIFDFDGTLLDIGEPLRRSISEVFRDYNIEAPIDLAIQEIGAVLETVQGYPLPQIILQSYEIFKHISSLKHIRYLKKLKIAAKLFTKYLSYAKDATIFTGVKDVLNYFNEFCDLYIVSHSKKESIVEHLEKANIGHYFKDVYGTDDIPELKPSPEALMPIFNQYSSFKGQDFIMVGDMPTDIEAGKEAGVWTIGIASGISKKEVLWEYNPDILVNSMKELINMIGIGKRNSNSQVHESIKIKS